MLLARSEASCQKSKFKFFDASLHLIYSSKSEPINLLVTLHAQVYLIFRDMRRKFRNLGKKSAQSSSLKAKNRRKTRSLDFPKTTFPKCELRCSGRDLDAIFTTWTMTGKKRWKQHLLNPILQLWTRRKRVLEKSICSFFIEFLFSKNDGFC